MKWHKTNVHFILMWIILLSTLLMAQDYVAVIIKSRGAVHLTRANSTRSITAQKGHVLRSGDKIETEKASFCAIKFLDDKSLLRIKQNSLITIEGKKEKEKIDKNIIVEFGTFLASIFKQKGSFKVTTPTSVASIKGTEFWTIQTRDGRTIYIALEGLIDLLNDAGRVLLRPGQTAVVKSLSQLPIIRLTDPNEIPTLEEEGQGRKSLEIEFQDRNGQTRRLKIDLEEK